MEPRTTEAGTTGLVRRPSGLSRWLGRVTVALVVLACIGLSVFAGFEIGKHKWFPHRVFDKVDRKLEQAVTGVLPKTAGTLDLEQLNSHLIILQADVGLVPLNRSGPFHTVSENGGGLASFGRDVLLLPYDGRIYAASSGKNIRATNITAPDTNRAAYEALADDPDFADFGIEKGYLRYNDLLHISDPDGPALAIAYSEYHPAEKCVTNTVALLRLDATVQSIDEVRAGPADWRILYRTKPCLPLKSRHFAIEGHMAGGKLAFRAPSTLYMTSGDFHFDGMRSEPGPGIAQDPTAEYGKILAIDTASGDSRIVSMGHRNPQGLTLASDGRLFSTEHGPRGGDELNLVRDGANYGWPLESYGLTYWDASAIPGSLSFGRHENFDRPLFSWVPSIAVSSVIQIDGFHPAWDGDLLVATLLDGSLFRLRLAQGRVVYSERIRVGSRIRDIHQHDDGRIVLWTDDRTLIFLSGRDRLNASVLFDKFVIRKNLSDRMADQLASAIESCAECHSFEIGDHERSPSLARIFEEDIASTSFQGYSTALLDRGGSWTKEKLAQYLRDPQSFAAGTSMPDPGIHDEAVIQELVSYLEEVSKAF
ncbi:hypothetical protein AVO45_01705 [Ruegeria marisrubri]|uniref:Cytochrome c domain-containing protein n=2 Tax=Ruegeria marisrubri TaxID=1685379 RepID=A0A101CYI0_9RHOB|nr:hypothetical protein AVO45_01705 [Ruegeria marisrubri]